VASRVLAGRSRGFLARSGRDRRERLAAIAADPRGTVLFEAPGRVGGTLLELAQVCGAGRAGAVCRELTKVHEQIVRGTLGELATAVEAGTIPARGEFVLIVGAGAAVAAAEGDALPAALEAVDRLVADGLARGEAARRVSAETGIPRRRLYVPAR
jgi:16S rRNA (cytidine1402-2'-O)-methyltransferase